VDLLGISFTSLMTLACLFSFYRSMMGLQRDEGSRAAHEKSRGIIRILCTSFRYFRTERTPIFYQAPSG
jgi:hypothetical protein